MSTPKKRPIQAEDLYQLQTVADAWISPDGRNVVFTVQRIDKEKEKQYRNLWLVPAGKGEARPFTFGDYSESNPAWSPDGRQIAFISNRGDEKQPQIYLIPVDGGEARPLTDVKGEFGNLLWSPDGRYILTAFRPKDKEAIEREEDEQKKELGVVSRHITRIFYRVDGAGYLPQARWQLWKFDATSGEGEPLVASEIHDQRAPAWSPDGRQIAFISNRSDDPDLNPDADDIFIVAADGSDERRLETPFGSKSMLAWSPDGEWLAYMGREGKGDWWRNTGLWTVPVDGSRPAQNLTAQYDLHISNGTIADVGNRPTLPPVWSPDGSRIYFQVTRHGSTLLYTITPDGQSLETLIGDEGVVGSFSFDKSHDQLVYTWNTLSDPGEIWNRRLGDGHTRPLTQINAPLLASLDLGEVEQLWYKGADGNDLQGWIIKPPGFDPNKKYPSILEIHGGPWVQYGHTFMHEFHYLAAQGYIVYFTNPRGGQGYGEEHSGAISNDWGTVDYADLMAWADLVAQRPYIDVDRMGVTGGSYGGYMTAWIIGHTHRFKAAVAQRVVSNLVSMWGSSDFNWAFQMSFGGRPPWENLENFWRQSPMKYIGNARTPTLVIHSEQDLRCALEQGQQLFTALKWQGVDTEFVVFPEESHGLSRGGRTDRRIARLNHIRRWFDKYL